MITEDEKRRAAEAASAVAENMGMTEVFLRRGYLAAVRESMARDDPRSKALWAGFEYEGEEPTFEEVAAWLYKKAGVGEEE